LQPWRGPTSSRLAIRLAPTARIPIPNIKPASRAADRADQLLNDSYKKLQDAVRADAKDMSQSPEVQLGYLKDAQKQWIAYRDASCTFDDSLAFGGALIGSNFRHVPALSPTSASMTSSASRRRSWVSPERRFRPAKALETAEKARILSPNS